MSSHGLVICTPNNNMTKQLIIKEGVCVCVCVKLFNKLKTMHRTYRGYSHSQGKVLNGIS